MRIETITAHPGLNPEYLNGMRRRTSAQNHNRTAALGCLPKVAVPKQPNRYMPHIGAKEAARHVGKGTLGPNASRTLRSAIAAMIAECTNNGTVDDNPGVLSPDHRERMGQVVKWTSGGKTKRGAIVEVIPAGKLPINFGHKVKDATSPRDHISYVVSCNSKLYWPRVSLLQVL